MVPMTVSSATLAHIEGLNRRSRKIRSMIDVGEIIPRYSRFVNLWPPEWPPARRFAMPSEVDDTSVAVRGPTDPLKYARSLIEASLDPVVTIGPGGGPGGRITN